MLCDKVCQRLAAGLWFSLSTPVSSNIIRYSKLIVNQNLISNISIIFIKRTTIQTIDEGKKRYQVGPWVDVFIAIS
jgi:hypothetical protein